MNQIRGNDVKCEAYLDLNPSGGTPSCPKKIYSDKGLEARRKEVWITVQTQWMEEEQTRSAEDRCDVYSRSRAYVPKEETKCNAVLPKKVHASPPVPPSNRMVYSNG